MKRCFMDRVTALLGEERLTIRLAVPCKTGFFPVDRRNGYKVSREEHRVVIRPVTPMATLFGWAPVYYFTGRLQTSLGGPLVLQGRITMTLSSKLFILVWTGGVLLGLAFGSVLALYSAFRWLLNPTEAALAALQGAGLMIGIGLSLLFFAAFLFSALQFLNRKDRERLKDFCNSRGGEGEAIV